MPNYKLPGFITYEIKKQVELRVERTLDYANADFPLDLEQIQQAVLPAATIQTLRDLEAGGFGQIQKHSNVHLGMLRDHMPIKRSCAVELYMPVSIFAPYGTQYFTLHRAGFTATNKAFLALNAATLDEPTTARLCTWIERAIRAKRLAEITRVVARDVLDTLAPTSQHMLALWPQLSTLLPDTDEFREWRSRFRNPVRRALNNYQPAPEIREKYTRLIVAADTVLTSGGMFQDYQHPDRAIKASIAHWEALNTDKRYT
jgi:hypothetical protein